MRLFIALDLTDKQIGEIHTLQQKLQSYLEGVKWTRPPAMHLTLKFLGEVEQKRIPGIHEAMRQAAAGTEPFRCVFGGSGVFPAPHKARVIWLGLVDGSGAVTKLTAKLDETLRDEGFAAETRPYTPHLTLGRPRYPLPPDRISTFLADGRLFSTVPSQISAMTLYESKLSRRGAAYTVLHRVKLGRFLEEDAGN